MGIVPLEFPAGESAASLGLTGRELVTIAGLAAGVADGLPVRAGGRRSPPSVRTGGRCAFRARVRIDTPQELEYVRHGGILQYVLRQLLAG